MQLIDALRYQRPARVSISGGGGKTTTLFLLARNLLPGEIWVSTTTHLAVEQSAFADEHVIIHNPQDLDAFFQSKHHGVILITGAQTANGRVGSFFPEGMEAMTAAALSRGIPLLLEADGSKGLPIKAPGEHEPVIPDYIDLAITIAGMDGLGVPLDDEHVHRSEIFRSLCGLEAGRTVNTTALGKVLVHPKGGLKNIPAGARRILILNKADTPEQLRLAGVLADQVIYGYDAVLAASLGIEGSPIHWVREKTAGVILAAGGSRRLGRPKQIIEFEGEPLVRRSACTALQAGLDPVVVVTGAFQEETRAALKDIPVHIVNNLDWQQGQSTSLIAGLRKVNDIYPRGVGGSVFLLSDQPMVSPDLLHELIRVHSQTLAPICAPFTAGKRANPVLFDACTFSELLQITGDIGGRSVMKQYPVEEIQWDDPRILWDVDTQDDLERLNQEQRYD